MQPGPRELIHWRYTSRAVNGLASGPRQSQDEPFTDGITAEGHNDGDRPSSLLDGSYSQGRRGDNHVDLEANDLRSEIGEPFKLAVRIFSRPVSWKTLPFTAPVVAAMLHAKHVLHVVSAEVTELDKRGAATGRSRLVSAHVSCLSRTRCC